MLPRSLTIKALIDGIFLEMVERQARSRAEFITITLRYPIGHRGHNIFAMRHGALDQH